MTTIQEMRQELHLWNFKAYITDEDDVDHEQVLNEASDEVMAMTDDEVEREWNDSCSLSDDYVNATK